MTAWCEINPILNGHFCVGGQGDRREGGGTEIKIPWPVALIRYNVIKPPFWISSAILDLLSNQKKVLLDSKFVENC